MKWWNQSSIQEMKHNISKPNCNESWQCQVDIQLRQKLCVCHAIFGILLWHLGFFFYFTAKYVCEPTTMIKSIDGNSHKILFKIKPQPVKPLCKFLAIYICIESTCVYVCVCDKSIKTRTYTSTQKHNVRNAIHYHCFSYSHWWHCVGVWKKIVSNLLCDNEMRCLCL